MKKLFTLLVSIILMYTAVAQKKNQTPDKRLAGADALLENVLRAWNAPGLAIAIVEKNKVVYARGFGYRDMDQKLPMTTNTLLAIGSCTKAFTAAVLGQLRSEGKLSFDDSPQKYIQELRFFNKEMDNTIIVKDLMAHRTGLPRHDLSWYFFNSPSKDSLLKRVAWQQPFTGVRQQYYYNNFMFLAQGVIAERITGHSWEQNVAKRFFEPLGMTRSTLDIANLKRADDVAIGYETTRNNVTRKLEYYEIAGMSPAGSINSSVNEMARWLIAWINGGRYEGKEILPSAYLNEAISSQTVAAPGLPSKESPDVHLANYGYAWALASYRGHYRVEHGGNIDGFSASTCFFPSDSIGIIVLVNQDKSSVPGIVRNLLADRMLGLPFSDWNKILKERRDKALKEEKEGMDAKVPDQKAGTRPSHILQEIAGSYTNPGYGTFGIVAQRDSLFAIFPARKYWLKHYHYNIFVPYEMKPAGIDTTDISQLRMNFGVSDAGEITSVAAKLEPATDPIVFKRSPVVEAVEATSPERYEGEYEIAGMAAKVYLKGNNILFLFVPGQPEYELICIGSHKFAIKNLDGFSLEFVEDDGRVNGVMFIQPNGTFRAKKK